MATIMTSATRFTGDSRKTRQQVGGLRAVSLGDQGATEIVVQAARRPVSLSSQTTSSTRSSKSYIRPYFRSRRVSKDEIEKPWLRERKSKWPVIIPYTGLLCGLALMGVLVYFGLSSVQQHQYCLVMEDNFSAPKLNSSIWTQEVQLGGFGNGEFEMTTNTDENVYIENGSLVIKPTLQNESLLDAPFALLNLTADGTCTSSMWYDCWAATNATNYTIINPVKSGRINTKGSASIKYGRVEVVAKMPVGDWLWPAIWMLPEDEIYGPWPNSGEIDIMESRGNGLGFQDGGNNFVTSTLHWGPTRDLDAYWRTTHRHRVPHTTYSAGFHTFGLEWSEKYLYTYVDSRLRQVLYTPFNQPQWIRGQFPQAVDGKPITNPWTTNRYNTPFDTPFYLVLNVAVGGTNGFFRDPDATKPWDNNALNASAYFWAAKDQWHPTWIDGQAQMEVSSVKMWQECDFL